MIDGSRNARLNRETPATFVERLTAGLRQIAQSKRGAMENNQFRVQDDSVYTAAGAVDTLAGYAGSLPLWDARLYALMLTWGATREPDSPDWKPGTEQARVLASLGRHAVYDPDYALTELVAAGTEDAIWHGTVGRAQAEDARDRLQHEVNVMRPIKLALEEQRQRLGIQSLTSQKDVDRVARAAMAVILEQDLDKTPQPEPVEKPLPVNVRARGSGYQAHVRVNGTQLQRQCSTIEDADELAQRWVHLRDHPDNARGTRRQPNGDVEGFYYDMHGQLQTKNFGPEQRPSDVEVVKLALAWATAEPGVFDREQVAA